MTAVVFGHYLAHQRTLIQARLEDEEASKRRVKALELNKREENETILQSVPNSDAVFGAGFTHVVAIPMGQAKCIPLTATRLENYTGHLRHIIHQASGYREAREVKDDKTRQAREKDQEIEREFVEVPALKTTSDQLCTLCKGGCCTNGDDRAYLSVYSMRQFMDSNPDLSADDVLQAYLSKLHPETIAGACINQGHSGCVLPREMRSDICNAYYCDSLRDYQLDVGARAASTSVLAIQRGNSNWNRFAQLERKAVVQVALLKAGEVRILPTPKV